MTSSALAEIQQQPAAIVETASTAVAAQAKAEAEARFLVAMHRPRNWATVRGRLLEAAKRPGFADVAIYSKPIGGGKKVDGPSIRCAEEVLRAMGNVIAVTRVLFDDDDRRIVRVEATDLESNVGYPHDLIIQKTVERSSIRDGQVVVGERTNSRGAKTYIVRATEDELLIKQAALVSKALRTSALRLCPSDILEDVLATVRDTQRNRDAEDPKGAMKKIADAFWDMGVKPDQLEQYLGHSIDGVTPIEIADLRSIYQAIKQGESTWTAFMGEVAAAKEAGNAKKATDDLRAKLKAKKPGGPPKAVVTGNAEDLAAAAAAIAERELDALEAEILADDRALMEREGQ